MPSSYSPNLGIELPATGEKAGTWGTTLNTNMGTLIEQAISGYASQVITDGADTVITIPNGATGVARNMYLELTGALTTDRSLIVPLNKKIYFIFNNTIGGYSVTVKVSGGVGVAVPNGGKYILVCNGTDVVQVISKNFITQLGIASNGANNDITSLSGLTTPLSIGQGGTGSTSGVVTLPSGTVMLFQQTNAPTGWTKLVTQNDAALRVVSGTVGSGGTYAFSGVFGGSTVTDGHAITLGEIPAHTHAFNGTTGNDSPDHTHTFPMSGGDNGGGTAPRNGDNTGGGSRATGGASSRHQHSFSGTTTDGGFVGGAHTHTLSGLAIKYVDLILASKN